MAIADRDRIVAARTAQEIMRELEPSLARLSLANVERIRTAIATAYNLGREEERELARVGPRLGY